MTAISYQIYGMPKRGSSAEEFEDRAAGSQFGRFAISDGATESSFCALWAELMVKEFVQSPFTDPVTDEKRIADLQQQWLDQVTAKPLPWHAQNKVADGAFATFLGLVIDSQASDESQSWRAYAVGDSCLFHIRQQQLHRAFPITCSQEFDSTPHLVSSRTSPERILNRSENRYRRGRALPGDRFWMMTDALALWFLQQYEAGDEPWKALDAVLADDSSDRFVDWIGLLQDRGKIRNDDVTLLGVQV